MGTFYVCGDNETIANACGIVTDNYTEGDVEDMCDAYTGRAREVIADFLDANEPDSDWSVRTAGGFKHWNGGKFVTCADYRDGCVALYDLEGPHEWAQALVATADCAGRNALLVVALSALGVA